MGDVAGASIPAPTDVLGRHEQTPSASQSPVGGC